MGTEKCTSFKLFMFVDIAIIFSGCVELVKEVVPPERNCDSLPRYCVGPEGGKEKAVQLVVSFKEKSGESRLPSNAAGVDCGREIDASVEENSAKSQLIDWLP
jgi:hypothetical protein